MYMFTFVILVIMIIGIFSQVYFAQIAAMNKRQVVVGEQILSWHESAVRFARDTAGLTFPDMSVGAMACRISPQSFLYAGEPGQALPANCNRSMGASDLPSGMSLTMASHRYETVIYANPAATRIVMTYVPVHPTDTQAPRAPTGFLMSDVSAQLARASSGDQKLTAGTVTESNPPGNCEMRRVVDSGGTPASFVTTVFSVPKQAGVCLARPGSVIVYTIL